MAAVASRTSKFSGPNLSVRKPGDVRRADARDRVTSRSCLGNEQASVVEQAVAVEFYGGPEQEAVDVHACGVDTTHAGARSEGEMDGADHLLVLEHVAGKDRRRVCADSELCERAAVLAARVERLKEPVAGVGVGVGDAPTVNGDANG